MAKGKTLEEAKKITPALVAEELGGLPKQKFIARPGRPGPQQGHRDYEVKKLGKAPRKRKNMAKNMNTNPKKPSGGHGKTPAPAAALSATRS